MAKFDKKLNLTKGTLKKQKVVYLALLRGQVSMINAKLEIW
jgi:hypothetical protein